MKDKYFWLTSTNQSDMTSLKISPKNRSAELKNLDGKAIWFKDSEIDEAKMFLKDLKKCIRDLYCNKYNKANRATWMTNSWVDKFD